MGIVTCSTEFVIQECTFDCTRVCSGSLKETLVWKKSCIDKVDGYEGNKCFIILSGLFLFFFTGLRPNATTTYSVNDIYASQTH